MLAGFVTGLFEQLAAGGLLQALLPVLGQIADQAGGQLDHAAAERNAILLDQQQLPLLGDRHDHGGGLDDSFARPIPSRDNSAAE